MITHRGLPALLLCLASACTGDDPGPTSSSGSSSGSGPSNPPAPVESWRFAGEIPILLGTSQVGRVVLDTIQTAPPGQIPNFQWRAVAAFDEAFDSVVVALFDVPTAACSRPALVATANGSAIRLGDGRSLASGNTAQWFAPRWAGRVLYARRNGTVQGSSLSGRWQGTYHVEGRTVDTLITGYVGIDGQLQFYQQPPIPSEVIGGSLSLSGIFDGRVVCPASSQRVIRTPSGEPLNVSAFEISGTLVDSTFRTLANGTTILASTTRYIMQLTR